MARTQLPVHPDDQDPPLPVAVRSSPAFLMKQVSDLFRQRFEGVLHAQQLHPRQYLLLLVLRDEGTMPQQALGARVRMDRTTTMQAVQRMAELGLVAREDDCADRRVYRLVLTPAGRTLVDVLEASIHRAEAQLLAPLPLAAQEIFREQLQAIIAAAGPKARARCDLDESLPRR